MKRRPESFFGAKAKEGNAQAGRQAVSAGMATLKLLSTARGARHIALLGFFALAKTRANFKSITSTALKTTTELKTFGWQPTSRTLLTGAIAHQAQITKGYGFTPMAGGEPALSLMVVP
jgi:hypothetical protein